MKKLLISLVVPLPMLFGCVSTSQESEPSWLHNHKNIDYLSAASNQQLANAVQGQTLKIVTRSQQRYQLTLQQQYFAASGRECFMATAAEESVVVCNYGDEWGISRNF